MATDRIRFHIPLPYLLLIGFMWLIGFLPTPLPLISDISGETLARELDTYSFL